VLLTGDHGLPRTRRQTGVRNAVRQQHHFLAVPRPQRAPGQNFPEHRVRDRAEHGRLRRHRRRHRSGQLPATRAVGVLSLADGFAKTIVGFDPGIARYGLTLYDEVDFGTHFDGFLNGNFADSGHIAFETPAIEFDIAGDVLAFSSNPALKALGGAYSLIGGGFGALDSLF
jgi:hypothetical protein